MSNWIRYTIWILVHCILVAGLCGCADTTARAANIKPFQKTSWGNSFEQSLNDKYSNLEEYIQINYAGKSLEERTAVRNVIMHDLIWLIDKNFYDYKYTLYHGKATIDFLGDMISLSLNAAGAITGGTQAKTVLAVLAGLNTAGKSGYNKAFLNEKATTVLFAKMKESRNRQKAKIFDGLRQSDNIYPLQRALDDLVGFMDAGSVVSAIADLEEQVQKPLQESEKLLREAETTLYDMEKTATTLPASRSLNHIGE